MIVLKTLDLFSGIGGFTLGLEATEGFTTYAFVEIEPFCQRILQKHWPHVTCFKDVRNVSIPRGEFDVICGGFPCQDVSTAAKYSGNAQSILGDRSGMWWEYYRLISEGLPKWVVIENVRALQNRGLGIILSQLAALGYDAEWHIIRACDVGFPHFRERLWILAHHHSYRVERRSPFPLQRLRRVQWHENVQRAANFLYGPALNTPKLCGAGHGIPNYVDRINAIGNAIVPQIAYEIGLAILEAENA